MPGPLGPRKMPTLEYLMLLCEIGLSTEECDHWSDEWWQYEQELKFLLEEDLIETHGVDIYATTKKGQFFLNYIKNIPLPITQVPQYKIPGEGF